MNDKSDTRLDDVLADVEAATDENAYQEALQRFILFWGEMASRWGINRTMAQIHALLYASEEALDTDQIMSRLQISRGNANMNLRSLTDWNLVRKVHQSGSRKDFYLAEKNVWKITAQVVLKREKREIEPVMRELQDCRATLVQDAEGNDLSAMSDKERAFCERIDNLIELMKMFEELSDALFPFLQNRSLEETRQFIELAKLMAKKYIEEENLEES